MRGRHKKALTEVERQFECVMRVYYILQLKGELPKKPKRNGFRIEAVGRKLELGPRQIHNCRARARKHVEKFHGKLPWWK